MILLIDNYDSFVHNLARYARRLGHETKVVRNDEISHIQIEAFQPDAILISPGPCAPAQAGMSCEVIERFYTSIPILGICLGHQCIGEVFGGRTIRAPKPVHGKSSMVRHGGEGLFAGLPNPLAAGRYHSLIPDFAPDSGLNVTAWLEDGETPMAVAHQGAPLYGIQFHPESVLTPQGSDILRNFLARADMWHTEKVAA